MNQFLLPFSEHQWHVKQRHVLMETIYLYQAYQRSQSSQTFPWLQLEKSNKQNWSANKQTLKLTRNVWSIWWGQACLETPLLWERLTTSFVRFVTLDYLWETNWSWKDHILLTQMGTYYDQFHCLLLKLQSKRWLLIQYSLHSFYSCRYEFYWPKPNMCNILILDHVCIQIVCCQHSTLKSSSIIDADHITFLY